MDLDDNLQIVAMAGSERDLYDNLRNVASAGSLVMDLDILERADPRFASMVD